MAEPSNQDFARIDEAVPAEAGFDARAEEFLRKIREDAAQGKLGKAAPPPDPNACPDCGDAGVVLFPDGRADQCRCVLRRNASRRLKAAQASSGISKRHARCSFVNFDVFGDVEAVNAVDAVQEWAESFARGAGPDDEGEGLYLYGPPGTGKTHLVYAAVNALLMRPNSESLGVLVVTGPDLLANLRRAYDPDPAAAEQGSAFLQAVKDAPLLVLDDLGAAKPSDWTTEQIHAITDHRLREMLPTLVTSNYDPEAVAERIGEAAASRLREVCRPVPLHGPDRRRKRHQHDGRPGGQGGNF